MCKWASIFIIGTLVLCACGTSASDDLPTLMVMPTIMLPSTATPDVAATSTSIAGGNLTVTVAYGATLEALDDMATQTRAALMTEASIKTSEALQIEAETPTAQWISPTASSPVQRRDMYTITGANLRPCPWIRDDCPPVAQIRNGTQFTVRAIVEGQSLDGNAVWYEIDHLLLGRVYLHSSVASEFPPTKTPLPHTPRPTQTVTMTSTQMIMPVPTRTNAPIATRVHTTACGGARICSEMSSCAQAYACLREGNRRLDGDGDGIPCESLCGN